MSWRIRMNVSTSPLIHKHNRTSKIQFHLTSSIPNTRNLKSRIHTIINHRHLTVKRCSSKEVIDKKRKTTIESPRFVLVCGQNNCGQLGLSTTIIERRKPQHLKFDENIQHIYAGAMHSCALTVTGYVYTWGCNDDGALGRITNDIDDEYTPGLFVLPEEIKSLCAGDSFTVALAKSGRAYISGCFRSSEGVLGLFEYKQVAQQAMVISFNQPIKHVACGADFCLLLTQSGEKNEYVVSEKCFSSLDELYSFGNNETGQLGRDTSQLVGHTSQDTILTWLKPCQIPSFKGQKILNIWAGGHGFFALTQCSTIRLFACGANSFGQLGHSSKQPIYTPVEIVGVPFVDKIISIACGLQHTLILNSIGDAYGLGRSDDGRLGNLVNDVLIPKQIDHLTNILNVAAGGSVSFAIDNHGQIYSFGMGDTCQTGHGDEDIFLPTLIKGKQLEQRIIEEISVGAQHTLFLAKEEEFLN